MNFKMKASGSTLRKSVLLAAHDGNSCFRLGPAQDFGSEGSGTACECAEPCEHAQP